MCTANKESDREDDVMIRYIEMESAHIDGLVKVEEECFNSGFARQTFERELENKIAIYVVALDGDDIIGYAGLWDICGEADIMHVGVLKERRRCGIAFEMLKALIELCKQRGVFAVNLEVRKSNDAAQRLYEKLNFERVGLRKNYYDGKEDAVLMKLELEKEE